jgi:hypothetical protein
MSVPVFYAPSLHPDCQDFPLPEQVAFFPVGLPGDPRQHPDAALTHDVLTAEQAVRESLPLAPAEARSALAEMLRLGEEYAAGGLLRELAAHRLLHADENFLSGRDGEFDDLEHFAATGELPERQDGVRVVNWSEAASKAVATPESIRRATVDCQKTLLLAYSLEERFRELAGLEERYQSMERSLLASLGEGDDSEVEAALGLREQGGAEESLYDGGSSLSWRVVVDAALPFLPQKGVLFTADTRMALDLRELGMLQPFPEDRAFVCDGWPLDIVTGLLYAALPGWRLVGRKRPLPERPWLDQEVEVFVARPKGGWSVGGYA